MGTPPSASSQDGAGTSIGGSPAPAGGPQPSGQQPPAGQQGGPQVTASGPKIKVDFGEANQALSHLKDAIDHYNNTLRKQQQLLAVEGPGNEQPSDSWRKNFTSLAKTEIQNIANQRDAAQAMLDNLQAQLRSQQETEDANAASLRGQQ